MSSAVLADKHVDSFGPELLNEAWRGTVCSFPHPAGEYFSSSPPSWGHGTGISDPPPPYLSLPELIGGRGGREKGWLTISFSFPLLSFLPLTYSICSWSSAPAVLAVLCSDLPSLVTSQFLQSRCRMLRFELTPLLWVNCDSFWGWTSFWKQREVRHVQWCWDNKLTCGELM